MSDTERLVKEFLAKGGEIRRIERGMRAADIGEPPVLKKRGMLANLKAKAAKL